MKTFRILTLGCKVNQYESEAMAQQFLRAGYRPAEEGEAVSVSVVNTCSVTNMSDRKSRKMIRQCAKDSTVVAVCGCYAQAKPEEAANIEGVDLSKAKYHVIDQERLLSWSPAVKSLAPNDVVLLEW